MSRPGPGSRFLILSASMGSGHDAVAGETATRLAAAGHDVARADVLSLLPPASVPRSAPSTMPSSAMPGPTVIPGIVLGALAAAGY